MQGDPENPFGLGFVARQDSTSVTTQFRWHIVRHQVLRCTAAETCRPAEIKSAISLLSGSKFADTEPRDPRAHRLVALLKPTAGKLLLYGQEMRERQFLANPHEMADTYRFRPSGSPLHLRLIRLRRR
jgi:hypothetical protein